MGLMLLLMAWIAEHRFEVLADYLRCDLLTWSSHYLGQLEEASRHPFFEGLARLTHLSLEGAQGALGIEVVYPRFYR